MLGMVDMYLMGHQDSVSFIGAVALGGVIFNFIYWGFAFLRMSISGVTAQIYGRNEKSEMALILQRGLFISIISSVLLLLLQIPLADLSFWLLEGSLAVKTIARDYYFIRIWAAPAAISLMVFYGWFLGMQNAFYPMIIAITVNLVNIVASFIFVQHFNMQAKGVALGSVCGQYIGLFLAIIFFIKKYRWVAPYFTLKISTLINGIRNFLNISGNIFIRTLFIIFVFTYFTSQSAALGDVTLAINSVLLQYLLLFSYFLDGFAYAGEALIGKYFGANNKQKLTKTVTLLLKWGLGFAIIFTLLYGFMGKTLLQLFTKQEEVLIQGQNYLFWIILIPITSFGSYIWDGVFIGITASKAMRNSVVIAAVFFFFVPFYLLQPHIGNHAIWLSMLLFMGSRSLALTIMFPRVIK